MLDTLRLDSKCSEKNRNTDFRFAISWEMLPKILIIKILNKIFEKSDNIFRSRILQIIDEFLGFFVIKKYIL